VRRPGRSSGALRERLRRARYAIADLFFLAGQGIAAVGRGIASAGRGLRPLAARVGSGWRALPLVARQAVAGVLAFAVLAALFVGLAVPVLPCELPGGDECPPADDAAEIVPAEALAYAHVNADPETEQYEKLTETVDAAPGFSEQILARALALIPGPGGATPDYATDIEPWFEGEAAVAIVPGPGQSSERVVLLEVADGDGAQGYAESLAAGLPQPEDYRGVELTTDERGVATAQVEGFLVIGSRSGVRAIVDTATGAKGATPLADDELATEVRDELPDHRFLELWVSRAGATDLVAASTGTLGSLAPFLSPGSTNGAAASLSADDDELGLAIRSALDPERQRTSPGFFGAFPSFEPTLTERLPEDSLAYLGIGDPGTTVRELLGQAAAEAPGIASGFEDLVDALRRDEDIDIEKDLLPALGDEGAFAIGPNDPVPYLEFVSKGVDEERARSALAVLQKPIAESIDPGTGLQAPVFDESEIAGVAAQSLRVSPIVELTYAVFDGLMTVASDPAAVEQLAGGEGGLDGATRFESATDGFEDELSLLVYFDLNRLIERGIEIGLAQVPAFNTFAADFRNLEALGLSVRISEDILVTDGRLTFSQETEDLQALPAD
jgi:hypothetical protein